MSKDVADTDICVDITQNDIFMWSKHIFMWSKHIFINGMLSLIKTAGLQRHKRFKVTLFIRTKHNMRIFELIPLIELQNDT